MKKVTPMPFHTYSNIGYILNTGIKAMIGPPYGYANMIGDAQKKTMAKKQTYQHRIGGPTKHSFTTLLTLAT